MNILKLPKNLTSHKYVVIECEFDIIRLILPNGDSYMVDIVEFNEYLLRQFDNDEEFIEFLLAGAVNFRRVQLLPREKHFIHIPEVNYG